jgi:hypothetical protein
MKKYKTIKTTKHFDGTYTVKFVASRLELLKAIFTGKLNLLLTANDAATLSSDLYTRKKPQYKKPAVKITVSKVSE